MAEKEYIEREAAINAAICKSPMMPSQWLSIQHAIEAIPAADVLPRDEAIKIGAELAAMHGSDATSQQLEEAYLKGVEYGMTRRDVRPVVLCRDCVNYVESDEANGEKMCVIDADWCVEDGCYYGFTAYTPPDWFCAGGKKREES